MKIAVLNYGTWSVDIINVERDFINTNYHGDIDMFLSYWCGYDIDNIEWMSNRRIDINQGLTIDDFDGDDDIKSNNTEEDETY